MVAKKKITQFNVRIPDDLDKAFQATRLKGVSNQHIGTAIVRLWVSLPEEVRTKLIFAESVIEKNPTAAQDSFVEAVRLIAEQVYHAHGKPDHKRPQKN